ncbi:MAG: hypothetical protein AAB403_23280, partial [Planctomycetota bacterium]
GGLMGREADGEVLERFARNDDSYSVIEQAEVGGDDPGEHQQAGQQDWPVGEQAVSWNSSPHRMGMLSYQLRPTWPEFCVRPIPDFLFGL